MDYQLSLLISELRPLVGTGEAVIRVNGLGARGLRWLLLSLDETKPEAVLLSADHSQECIAHPLDLTIAPLPARASVPIARAKLALTEAWHRVRPTVAIDHQGYVPALEDNLISDVTSSMFLEELSRGDGGELAWKIRAVHSSAALVVNTFARWKASPSQLSLAGLTGFRSISLEAKCTVCPGRRPANLDVVAHDDHQVIGVESKLLETLGSKKAAFAPAYDALQSQFATSKWYALIPELRHDPSLFRQLDASQLIKHSIGLTNQYPGRTLTLIYLYWEPSNASDFPVYASHRADLERFGRLVAGDPVAFRAMSYAELWAAWDAQDAPEWLRDHVGALRARYEVSI